MRIGIIADIHDNIWHLATVLEQLTDCDTLLCLGDYCAPFTMTAIGEGFDGEVHAVWGNNDGDKLLLTRMADRAGNITLHGDFADLVLDDRSVAMTHYPRIARPLALSGQFDLVCHGHDHTQRLESHGQTLLVNPGEVMGRFGTARYAVYDTTTHQATLHESATPDR